MRRKRDQKDKNTLLAFTPRKMCGYNWDFLQGCKLPGAWHLLAVSWIWKESSTGFFHIRDSYWHRRQLCKSPAPSNSPGCSFIINYERYLYRTGEYYVKAGAQLAHKAVWGAAHSKGTPGSSPLVSPHLPAPPPRAEVEKGGGKRHRQEAEGGAGLSIPFYALTSFLLQQGEQRRKQRGEHTLKFRGWTDPSFYTWIIVFPQQPIMITECPLEATGRKRRMHNTDLVATLLELAS